MAGAHEGAHTMHIQAHPTHLLSYNIYQEQNPITRGIAARALVRCSTTASTMLREDPNSLGGIPVNIHRASRYGALTRELRDSDDEEMDQIEEDLAAQGLLQDEPMDGQEDDDDVERRYSTRRATILQRLPSTIEQLCLQLNENASLAGGDAPPPDPDEPPPTRAQERAIAAHRSQGAWDASLQRGVLDAHFSALFTAMFLYSSLWQLTDEDEHHMMAMTNYGLACESDVILYATDMQQRQSLYTILFQKLRWVRKTLAQRFTLAGIPFPFGGSLAHAEARLGSAIHYTYTALIAQRLAVVHGTTRETVHEPMSVTYLCEALRCANPEQWDAQARKQENARRQQMRDAGVEPPKPPKDAFKRDTSMRAHVTEMFALWVGGLGMRRDATHLYQSRYRNGLSTYSWERTMTIEDGVFAAAQTLAPRVYDRMVSSGIGKMEAQNIKQNLQRHPALPPLGTSPLVVAFRDGLYDGRNNRYYEHRRQNYPPDQPHADRYFDEDILPYMNSLPPGAREYLNQMGTPELLTQHERYPPGPDVHFPGFERILSDQGLDQASIFVVLALIGRAVFPLGKYDDWQIALLFYGIGGTGKTVILRMMREMVSKGRVLHISPERANGPFVFGSYDPDRHCMVHIDETPKGRSGLGAESFKQMVTGGEMSAEAKGIQAYLVDFEAHTTLACNHWPRQWKTAPVERRLVPLHMMHKPREVNPRLFKRFLRHAGLFTVMAMRAYHILRSVVTADADLKHFLTPIFHRCQERFAATIVPLHSFLMSDAVILSSAMRTQIRYNSSKARAARFRRQRASRRRATLDGVVAPLVTGIAEQMQRIASGARADGALSESVVPDGDGDIVMMDNEGAGHAGEGDHGGRGIAELCVPLTVLRMKYAEWLKNTLPQEFESRTGAHHSDQDFQDLLRELRIACERRTQTWGAIDRTYDGQFVLGIDVTGDHETFAEAMARGGHRNMGTYIVVGVFNGQPWVGQGAYSDRDAAERLLARAAAIGVIHARVQELRISLRSTHAMDDEQ